MIIVEMLQLKMPGRRPDDPIGINSKIADENPHLFQRDVERIVNTIFEEITDALANGDRVELRGLALFQ